MQINLDTLPEDPVALKEILRNTVVRLEASEAQVKLLNEEIERLQAKIQNLLRHRFGARSEQVSSEQLRQAIEGTAPQAANDQGKAETAQGKANENGQTSETQPRSRPRRKIKPKRNLGSLPAHLPRIEEVIDIDDKTCSCCGGPLHQIGETRTETLDRVPARLRVKVTRRPRYGCRACEATVVQAPAPQRPITGGMASEALLVHVLVSKFCDSLPLYRQADIFRREGINLDRSTLGDWITKTCWWLQPLYNLILSTTLSSPVLFADDTTLPVLNPGKGKTRTGRLWCYAADPRPWQGSGHPVAAYIYSKDRKGIHPAEHLVAFSGILQVDGYTGFTALQNRPQSEIILVFCWAHVRRRFHEFFNTTKSPLAANVLAEIAKLYEIETEIRGSPAGHRKQVRQQRSRPILEALLPWLQVTLEGLSGTSPLAEAIGYTLRHWEGLLRFLDDGRMEIDNNFVERGMKGIAVTRKNALFAGSDSGAYSWAIALTLINTAKLNDVEPLAWLTDALEALVSGRIKSHELAQLLPWNWKPPQQINQVPMPVAA